MKENTFGVGFQLRCDTTRAMTFDQLDLPLESIAADPFRPRGEKESELTFWELIKYSVNTPDYLDISDIKAEMHERLTRTISIFFLPLLAFPVGISSRRTAKSLRMVVGVVLLILYYYILQFGEALVRRGKVEPFAALWVPCLLFAAMSVWLFWVAERRPGQDPLSPLFDGLNLVANGFKRLFRRRKTPSSAAS